MEHKISLLKRAGECVFPVKMDMGDGSRIEGMGMSLRDYFAAKAMQGDLASQDENTGYYENSTPDEFLTARAEFYYRMADAMLRAREK
ncbi:hypothetical protein [Morganella morganii]|uniref:hypothetical protein n=1 Tax=Morganella morganii TaxID=582 RepID=UPI003EBD021A